MFEQQILFDYQPKINYRVADEYSPPVGWSYSRRNLFETCLLWYYYNYYGASKKTAPNEPIKEQLHFLKHLKPVKMRVGEILHLAVRTYFQRQKQNRRMSALGLSGWAQKIFLSDLTLSTEFQKDRSVKPYGKTVLLSEFYHNIPEAKDLWEEANLSLVNAIANFMESPVVEDFRLGGEADSDSIVERRLYMKAGTKTVSGQIDLAFKSGGRTKIIDWKSGFSDGSEDSLQLFSYALLVNNKYGIDLNLIDIYKVYLETEEVSAYRVEESGIMRAKSRIIQDLDRMQSLHHYGKNAIFEAFTPCEQSQICRMCPFRTVCSNSGSKEN